MLTATIKKTLRKAWSELPSWRIVEDVMRYPLAIDKRVEYKGGVVPDFCIQHNGSSKRKRKLTDPSRSVVMPPEVATVAKARQSELRAKAREILGAIAPQQSDRWLKPLYSATSRVLGT